MSIDQRGHPTINVNAGQPFGAALQTLSPATTFAKTALCCFPGLGTGLAAFADHAYSAETASTTA